MPEPQCDFASQATTALDTIKDSGDITLGSDLKPSVLLVPETSGFQGFSLSETI